MMLIGDFHGEVGGMKSICSLSYDIMHLLLASLYGKGEETKKTQGTLETQMTEGNLHLIVKGCLLKGSFCQRCLCFKI